MCIERLSSQQTIRAAEFCGFSELTLTPAHGVLWCMLALVVPWLAPLLPYLFIAIDKSHAVTCWHRHLRKKNFIALLGKAICWAFAVTLCILTEEFILNDPARLLPEDEEVKWTFGQILSVISLIPVLVSITTHLGKLPSYPIPAFEPSNSHFTLYIQCFGIVPSYSL